MNKASDNSFTVHAMAALCMATVVNFIGFSQTNTNPSAGTGQSISYDTMAAITMPATGQAFYGQNSDHPGNMRSYTNNGNGWAMLSVKTCKPAVLLKSRSANQQPCTRGLPDKTA